MLLNGNKILQLLAVVVLVMCGTMSVAQAEGVDGKYDGANHGKTVWMAEINVKFQQECSTCHIAYPPGMLPTESWLKIMAGLEKHFDTDASLPTKEVEEITAFVVDNSSDYWGAELAPMRITETDWFQRLHNSYILSPDIWQSPAVKSPANCPACHTQAERGDFSERNVRLPK